MTVDLTVTWLSAACTLAIFSFLWKENPVYRFFEHLFMGLSLGWGIVTTWTDSLVPKWFNPLFGIDVPKDGSYSPWNLLWILALAAGMMWYFIFTRKLKWIARIVIGFFIGVGAGLGIQGFFRLQLPQVAASFKSLWVRKPDSSGALVIDVRSIINNLVFTVTLYCSTAYFLFTFRRDRPALRSAAAAGRWLMMIAFGAMFGYTVMARLSLLIDRMQFLVVELPAAVMKWLGIIG
ncbi:MAG: hypothetical protein ACYTKD_20430 [Planctomycetota bacterium]|jgi:hypothetical protein